MQIYPLLEAALLATDPADKCRLTTEAAQACAEAAALDTRAAAPQDIRRAGQPPRPPMVAPTALQNRSPHTTEGYAALLHAIAHIEFNAINLALDAAYRFRTLPERFIRDWVQVAAEEAQHFQLMRARVQYFGFDYGDFPAHNHLWVMADKTAYDPLLRMALVPRVLEARGLDVTPGIRAKVAARGDTASCAVLDIIYRDEIGHVAVGNRWYQHLCAARGLDAVTLFRNLMKRYDLFIFRGYVNTNARTRAGFSAFELAMLAQFEADRRVANGSGARQQKP